MSPKQSAALINRCTLVSCLLLLPMCSNAKKKSKVPPTATDMCCCKDEPSCLKVVGGITKESPKRVYIDFKTKEIFFEDKYMSPKKPVQIVVLHLNAALYEVTIGETDTFNASPLSGSVLSTLLAPSTLSPIAAKLIGIVGSVPAEKTTKIQNYIYHPEALNGRTFQSTIREALNPLRMECTPAECIRDLQKVQSVAMQSISEELEAEIESANHILFEYKKLLASLEEVYPECASAYKHDPDEIHQKLQTARNNFIIINKMLTKTQAVYNDEMEQYEEDLERVDKSLREAHMLIGTFYTTAFAEVEAALKTISAGAEDSLISRLHTLAQAEHCYKSLPLFFTKDTKKINIEIKPRGTTSTLPKYGTTFNLPWMANQVYGVSTGFYIDGLYNDNPVIVTSDTGVNQTFSVQEDGSGSRIGLGISGQAYFGKHYDWLGKDRANYLAFTFGGGLSIETNPKPRVMLGAAFVSGDTRRFIISAGLTLGHVSRTSDFFKNKNFATAPSDFSRDVVKAAGYLSMSYSLFGQ